MFNKLIARFQDKSSQHPLGSDAKIDELLADITPGDSERTLIEIDDWLVTLSGHAAEIGWPAVHHALQRLDQFSLAAADQLLLAYLSEGNRYYLNDVAWSRLDGHAGELFQCYADALQALAAEAKTDADKSRVARSAARAIRAWALRKKVLRLRYRAPAPALWKSIHDLLHLLARHNLLQTPVVAYRDEAETSPLNEYLIGIYLELVPTGNLAPQQLEVADRFLRYTGGLELSQRANAGTGFSIDLAGAAGPRRYEETGQDGPTMRFCSTVKLRPALMKLASQVRRQIEVPAWLVSAPAKRPQIEAAILTLALHWAPAPPTRSSARLNQQNELKVLFGFSLGRRMVAASNFAREGRQFRYEGDDVARLYEESRFGRVSSTSPFGQTPAADEAVRHIDSPLEILQKLELAGDKAQMETWLQLDGSESGLGAAVPALFPRHRIGALVVLRHADGLEWRLGLIRRIGRDATNRPNIGIESLGQPSICAQAKPAGASCVWTDKTDSGHDGWSDAIIVTADGKEVLLPLGTFEAGLEVVLRSEGGARQVRLQSLLDRGADYDRVQFVDVN